MRGCIGCNPYTAGMIPTSSSIEIAVGGSLPRDVGAVAVFLTSGGKIDSSLLRDDFRRGAARLVAARVVRGKAREIAFDLVGEGKSAKRVYVVGLGDPKKVDGETIRQSA